MVQMLGLAFEFIPFFFLLAIVYGGLQISKLFDNKAANMLIAIAIAMFGALTPEVSAFIYQVLPVASIFFVVFFFIGFVWKFFDSKKEKDYTLGIVVMGLLMLLGAGLYQAGSPFPLGDILSENLMVGIAIIFIIAIFYAAYKQKS